MTPHLLPIIDENENIIGVESRANIHKNGLLHREIDVWLFTPKAELIFQHRSKTKDTYPDMLDASASGHVEIGSNFEDAALAELEEETGIKTTLDNLIFLKKIRENSFDRVTGMTNNSIRAVYAYRFDGSISELKIEEGMGLGFEIWPIEKVMFGTDEEKARIIPAILNEQMLECFRIIQKLL